LANGLGTSGYANENRGSGTCCTIGDIILSVNSYGLGTYLPADGTVLSIQANSTLFSILGTRFGGNGTTNFALPDLTPCLMRGNMSGMRPRDMRSDDSTTVAGSYPCKAVAIALTSARIAAVPS
jgi:microcystin-dependent protein